MKAADLNDRLSSVIYTIAGQWGKQSGQPHGLVLMLHNQLYKLVMKHQDTLVSIWGPQQVKIVNIEIHKLWACTVLSLPSTKL